MGDGSINKDLHGGGDDGGSISQDSVPEDNEFTEPVQQNEYYSFPTPEDLSTTINGDRAPEGVESSMDEEYDSTSTVATSSSQREVRSGEYHNTVDSSALLSNSPGQLSPKPGGSSATRELKNQSSYDNEYLVTPRINTARQTSPAISARIAQYYANMEADRDKVQLTARDNYPDEVLKTDRRVNSIIDTFERRKSSGMKSNLSLRADWDEPSRVRRQSYCADASRSRSNHLVTRKSTIPQFSQNSRTYVTINSNNVTSRKMNESSRELTKVHPPLQRSLSHTGFLTPEQLMDSESDDEEDSSQFSEIGATSPIMKVEKSQQQQQQHQDRSTRSQRPHLHYRLLSNPNSTVSDFGSQPGLKSTKTSITNGSVNLSHMSDGGRATGGVRPSTHSHMDPWYCGVYPKDHRSYYSESFSDATVLNSSVLGALLIKGSAIRPGMLDLLRERIETGGKKELLNLSKLTKEVEVYLGQHPVYKEDPAIGLIPPFRRMLEDLVDEIDYRKRKKRLEYRDDVRFDAQVNDILLTVNIIANKLPVVISFYEIVTLRKANKKQSRLSRLRNVLSKGSKSGITQWRRGSSSQKGGGGVGSSRSQNSNKKSSFGLL